MTTKIVVIFLMVVAFVIIVIIARNLEKKIFNKGYCKECDGKLRVFDTDSHGGRGYKCEKCGSSIWISYRVDNLKKI